MIQSHSAVTAPQQSGPDEVPIYELGEPLPPAVSADRRRLSAESKQEIKRLMQPDPGNFLFQLVYAWLGVVAAVMVAQTVETWWVTLLAICFIATRQNILALLMHEQCHKIGFRSKGGDLLANCTCAYPLLLSVEMYRRLHLAHHQSYFTEKDPDYRRKQGKAWTFPQRGFELLRLFVLDLAGVNFINMLRGKRMAGAAPGGAKPAAFKWMKPAFYLLLAAVLAWTGSWGLFLVYWFLPMVTVFQVIVRWGAICEHKYNLRHPDLVESTPVIEPRWWEMLVLPNLNFTLHVYHHWYPAVPHSKLPAVHEIFRREGLLREENVFHGYGPYLRYLLRGPNANTQGQAG